VDSVGGVRIIAKHSGSCLDVPGGSNQDGLLIQQFACGLGRNQRWIYAERGPYRFQLTATPIGRYTFTLQENRAYSFSLSNLSPGVTPLMHLWSRTHGNVTPLGLGPLPGGAIALNYSVPAGRGGTYTFFVHAAPGGNTGTASLTVRQNNAVFRQYPNVPVGGTAVNVPASSNTSRFRYESAALPGEGNATLILALDNLNHLEGFDYGVSGHAPRVTGSRITRIVIASMSSNSRSAVLYANDIFRDNDHDGIGYGLERELGTCDLKQAQPRCAAVFNTSDTDRDGIEDGVEVFGVEDGGLAFPSWGANPLHKDLFVEADWTEEFQATPLNQERIRRLEFHLAHGPAAHLDNPDGRDGIALHVDAGIIPTDPADRTLYGAWGGVNRVTLAAWQASYPAPPAGSFDSRRLPYFRQLLLLKAGGQNGFGRFWYATGEDPDTIMHEFGHTVGLHHESVISGLNCSPAYPSIMSYATPHSTFLTGDDFPPDGINPSRLCEADGLGSGITDLSFITSSLGGIPVDLPTGTSTGTAMARFPEPLQSEARAGAVHGNVCER
jgi:Ricin-type beta-trefoil lectin domain-like